MEPSYRRRVMPFRWRTVVTLLLWTAAGALVGLLVAQRTPYLFRVSAELLVMPGRETSKARAAVLFAGGPGGIPKVPSPDFVNSEIVLLKSPSVLRDTVESLARDLPGFHERTLESSGMGLFSGLASFADSISLALDLEQEMPLSERSVREWAERLVVHVAIRTDTIEVVCLVEDSALGEAFLERLIETYERAHVHMHTEAEVGALLADEVERLRGLEAEAEEALRAFRLRTGIVDLEATVGHLVQRKLAAEAAYRALRESSAATAASARQIDESLREVPARSVAQSVSSTDPTHGYAESLLLQSEQSEIEIEARFDPSWKPLQRLREASDIVRELLSGLPEMRENSSVVESENPTYTMLRRQQLAAEIEVRTLASQRASFRARLAELDAELVAIEDRRAEHTALVDALTGIRADLGEALRADQAARVSGVLDEAGIVNVRVISKPKAEIRPERQLGRDRRLSVVLGWAAFAALASAGFLALRSALRDELRASGFLLEERAAP